MASQLAILTDGLTKRYGRNYGCREICLGIAAGQVFGFLGPNGAGKSTVIKLLAGLLQPTAGQALIFGHPAGSAAAGQMMGFVPETFGLPLWPTAREALTFYGRVSRVAEQVLPARVDEVIERVGLSPTVRTQRIGTLSKGMRQRLAVAAALLHQPKLLLLDEPTSAMDPVGRRDMRELILRLREEGVTIFLNSHILSDVESVADQIAIIRSGAVLRSGTPAELTGARLTVMLRAEPLSPALEQSLRSLGTLTPQGGGRLSIQLHAADDLPEVARRVVAAGAALLELTPQRQSLEEFFMAAMEEVKPGA